MKGTNSLPKKVNMYLFLTISEETPWGTYNLLLAMEIHFEQENINFRDFIDLNQKFCELLNLF
jgi:hypothetical protein